MVSLPRVHRALAVAVAALCHATSSHAAELPGAPPAENVACASEADVEEACWLSLRASRARHATATRKQTGARRAENKVFLWMSDIHADPLYGKPPPGGVGGQQCKKPVNETQAHAFGIVGCDPPYELMSSAAKVAAKSSSTYQFVTFTGDWTRHAQNNFRYPWGNVTSTIQNVTKIIISEVNASVLGYSGGGQAFGTLGNDDSPQNYYLNVTTDEAENPWLANVGDVLHTQGAMSSGVVPNYSYGGFFEEEMGGIVVLMINTIVYSVSHEGAINQNPEDPFHQFAWLRSRLQSAVDRNVTVWIMGHIPPGIETYGYSELWRPAYVEKYLAIVQDPTLGPAVAAQLFGHVHKEEFRLLPNAPRGAGPVLLTSALSPIYQTNPQFRAFEYDPATGRPVSYNETYAELREGTQEPLWSFGYDLVDAYPVLRQGVRESGFLLMDHFAQLAERLGAGLEEWDTYAGWYATQRANDLQGCGVATRPQGGAAGLNETQKLACRKKYICALTVRTQAQFNDCEGASAWEQEGQRLSSRLLPHSPHLYYPTLHHQWLAEQRDEKESVRELRGALADGRISDVESCTGRLQRSQPS
mmetsp:Transcript_67023/g.174465  ORF Transcript_67023/g.174465 Transcript_67023/m.174465 type:complete len:587 (+) Transcript_67023:84-1844(+)